MSKTFSNIIFGIPLFLLSLFIVYVGLFQNNSVDNVNLILHYFGKQGLLAINIILIAFLVPLSLKLMNAVTGSFGLERFKSIFAISIGMTTLGFSALQFIDAIATSSAEGATVVVEIFQQITHLAHTGQLEQYGLIGMLTSDASGPWNSSIFPLIILIVWMIRRKKVSIELKQLHIPMFIQFVLYAQQFLFALDLQYTLLEILLMVITATFFVIGMFSFLVRMFKVAEKEEENAIEIANQYNLNSKNSKVKKESFFYLKFIDLLAKKLFKLLTFNFSNQKVESKHMSVKNKNVGFGQISRAYVFTNALQLTLAMTVAMFALVTSMQFLATQIKMSDAEAALFGTAGLTSAPEALVAFKAGPYINSLLLVGSNIIDGWFSAIGQTFLLGYAEIVSNGAISFIPLHPAISYLTFLSWTQGVLVWFALYLYARKNQTKGKIIATNIIVVTLLSLSIIYYFGGAWFSAQALGYGAQYALDSLPFKMITSIIGFLQSISAQKFALILNVTGLFFVLFWWSGLIEKIKNIGGVSAFTQTYADNINKLMQKYGIIENQHILLLLDKSASMDKSIYLFKNKWIDIVFKTLADLALVLDDDAHVHVYTAHGKKVDSITTLLTPENQSRFIDSYVGRDTYQEIYYSQSLIQIYQESKSRNLKTKEPILVICLTDGYGKDYPELQKTLQSMQGFPVYVHFVLVYGNNPPDSANILEDIKKSLSKSNFSYSLLPSFEFSNQEKLQEQILKGYSKFLKKV